MSPFSDSGFQGPALLDPLFVGFERFLDFGTLLRLLFQELYWSGADFSERLSPQIQNRHIENFDTD
jgi:hypothetical protein